MNDPRQLLADLLNRGFSLKIDPDDPGRLLVSPASRLTAGDRVAMTEHKQALLKLLAARILTAEDMEWIRRLMDDETRPEEAGPGSPGQGNAGEALRGEASRGRTW